MGIKVLFFTFSVGVVYGCNWFILPFSNAITHIFDVTAPVNFKETLNSENKIRYTLFQWLISEILTNLVFAVEIRDTQM